LTNFEIIKQSLCILAKYLEYDSPLPAGDDDGLWAY